MRINEFASAEDALTMWKVISDNTWAAIAQQAQAEAKQKAERAAARKSVSKRGSGKSTAKPAPPKRLPPPLQHVSAPIAKDAKPASEPSTKTPPPQQAKSDVRKQTTQQMGGGIKQQQAKAANSQQPNALSTQQKAVGMAQQQPNSTNPQAAQQQPNYPAAKPAPATTLMPQNSRDRFAGNTFTSTLAKAQQRALNTMKE